MESDRSPRERGEESDDITRATQRIATRLSGLGIPVDGDEDPELLTRLADAVDRFEEAVRSRGGDLMVDEPPPGATPQPDDPAFTLPVPRVDESLGRYLERLTQATDAVQRRPPL